MHFKGLIATSQKSTKKKAPWLANTHIWTWIRPRSAALYKSWTKQFEKRDLDFFSQNKKRFKCDFAILTKSGGKREQTERKNQI